MNPTADHRPNITSPEAPIIFPDEPATAELAALADGQVAVRNSRHPDGPVLVYTLSEMTAFLAGVRNGEFDDLGTAHVPA